MDALDIAPGVVHVTLHVVNIGEDNTFLLAPGPGLYLVRVLVQIRHRPKRPDKSKTGVISMLG